MGTKHKNFLKPNFAFAIISVLMFVFIYVDVYSQEKIVERYGVVGGRGAETSRILIGDINNKTPILYYLSYNACPPNDVWMLHFLPWTTYPVEIPEPAKVLIKTFENHTLELPIFYSYNGTTLSSRMLDNKPLERYVSETHCKISYDQLLLLIKEGVMKIRIQTILPNGYIERVYDNNDFALSIKKAHDILIKELKPIDLYEGF